MRRSTLLALAILLCYGSILAQTSIQLSNWSSLSSLVTTRDADADASGTVWVATAGGVYAIDPDSTIREYRNVNALQTLSTTAVLCVQGRQEVFVGGDNGSLDIHQSDGTWLNVTDIVRATEYPKRGIRDLLEHDGTLYIATDFGLVTYDVNDRLFIETVDRIGSLQEKTRANSITIANDSIWVATDSGLAVAPLNIPTLRLPSVWTILGKASGLPQNAVSRVCTYSGSVAAATGATVSLWSNGAFSPYATLPKSVRGLTASGPTLYASTEDGVYTGTAKLPIPWSNLLLGHNTKIVDGELTIMGYVLDKGLEQWNGTSVDAAKLNTPISNQFARLSIDTKGALWVATDIDPPRTGQGLTILDNGTWQNVNIRTHPVLTSNSCYRVSALADGSVMIGSWGSGAYKATWEGADVALTRYTSSNSAFQGISSDNNYVLASDASRDRQENVWMINEQSASTLFVRIAADGTTTGYSNCFDARNNLFRALAVDGSGTKWAGSTSGTGLVAYNEKGTEDRADDICNVVRTSNSNLPDNVVTALRIDKTGALWIGTAKGVAVISGPGGVTNSAIPYVRRITALAAVVVNDIFIDALNYKWVATTSGVYVLNEDGTAVLAIITKNNSPLLDDNIRSVVVDDRTGVAYFGTSSGCSVAQTSSIQPLSSFELSFHPQPFRIEQDDEVVIDGLAADADVRIMTPGGIQVAAFQARGKQAVWDGRDTRGNKVPPGVYIVQSSSAAASASAVGKLVVKR